MINLKENIILISNHYSHICQLYTCHQTPFQEMVLDYETGKQIIDKIFNNALECNFIPKIYLLGGDVISYWNSITKLLIEYIQSKKNYCEIYLQFENENEKYEEIFLYLKEKNVNLNFIYNENTNSYLEKAIYNKPFLNLYYLINNNSINSFFDQYIYFNDINIKKLKLLFDNNFLDINIFNNELFKVRDYIINNFLNNKIALIPENINYYFIKNLIINNEQKQNLPLLHHLELIKYACPMVAGKRVIINQLGELFFCSHYQFNSNNPMYLGNIQDCDLESINIIKKIYDFLPEEDGHLYLTPQTESSECKSCDLFSVCCLNCFANNLQTTNDSKTCFVQYCKIEQIFYNITSQIIDILDNNKNELFKNYYYIQCSKGLEVSI